METEPHPGLSITSGAGAILTILLNLVALASHLRGLSNSSSASSGSRILLAGLDAADLLVGASGTVAFARGFPRLCPVPLNLQLLTLVPVEVSLLTSLLLALLRLRASAAATTGGRKSRPRQRAWLALLVAAWAAALLVVAAPAALWSGAEEGASSGETGHHVNLSVPSTASTYDRDYYYGEVFSTFLTFDFQLKAMGEGGGSESKVETCLILKIVLR